VSFVFRDRPMFYCPWNDNELAFFEPDVPVSKLHAKAAFDHEEQLVFVFMTVPNELALKLHDLDELTVELADDSRAPMLVQESELFVEINFVHREASIGWRWLGL
jgi:hypothetical protein